jgi:hypothetical protein
MNLSEQTNRIKKMMGIISEMDDSKNYEISFKFNPEVVKLQKELVGQGFNIGKYGPKGDGVDGKYGPLTDAAYKAYKEGKSSHDFNPKKEDIDKEEEFQSSSDSSIGGNIIIGDSQTPYVARNTSKAKLISSKPGKSSLWEGGQSVPWLISAVKEFPVSENIKNVVIVIGTNGAFGKVFGDDIPLLFKVLKKKFPNAKFLVVQGSWGWGGLKNVKESQVRNYYKQYEMEGATLIEPPIGDIEPHQNHPVYSIIGSQIDKRI